MEAKLGGGVREEEEKHTEQGGERVCWRVGPWVAGFPPAGRLPTTKLSPSVATRCHKRTRRGAHAEAHTHLAASVVGIAAETCEAEALIKTTDHR